MYNQFVTERLFFKNLEMFKYFVNCPRGDQSILHCNEHEGQLSTKRNKLSVNNLNDVVHFDVLVYYYESTRTVDSSKLH